jgi:hypothetical protein
MTCGVPAPDVAIATEPFVEAILSGVNVTAIVHFAEAASAPPQGVEPLPAEEKAALALIAVMFTEALPLFVTVMVFGALVIPMAVAAKVRVVGLKVSGTVGPPVAVPVSATICGLRAPLVAITRPPSVAPLEAGAKVTIIVHLVAAFSEAAQVPLVME